VTVTGLRLDHGQPHSAGTADGTLTDGQPLALICCRSGASQREGDRGVLDFHPCRVEDVSVRVLTLPAEHGGRRAM
jgi:hypothetical protein